MFIRLFYDDTLDRHIFNSFISRFRKEFESSITLVVRTLVQCVGSALSGIR